MKKIILLIGFSLVIGGLSFGQSLKHRSLKTKFESYEKVMKSIKQDNKKGKKNTYSHLNYKETKSKFWRRRSFKRQSPFTFLRKKPKQPQNSYAFNW
jgi:hypothetical protein